MAAAYTSKPLDGALALKVGSTGISVLTRSPTLGIKEAYVTFATL
ncbi:MAG: hypothetical protein AVDCRST_MAG86-686 [uncultured Truepera sp.]|uniref:Uncharacterized protein n=1 Tax=uncultured Truepera sp. TaxID=543023 RepID=A0A6J4USQ3_9DEIN|nr:MAG: hypothetical protein AVDCRST_MAG86-686 [uncultured Truepera sp.]